MMEHNAIKNVLTNTLRDHIALLSVPEYDVIFTEELIAFENVIFNAQNRKVTYVKPIYIPNRGNMATLGPDGYDYEHGLFQVDIRTPLNTGNAVLWTVADHIGNVFNKGLVLSVPERNFEVRIRNVYAAAALTDDAWHWAPVTVDWYTHICRA